MGIQDRDDYGAHHRNVSPLHRRRAPWSSGRSLFFWIVALTALVVAALRFMPIDRPRTVAIGPPPPRPVVPLPTLSIPRPARPAVAPTASLSYGAPSVSSAPIYRCGREYSHEPCAGGRAIDASSASGFDSRPSERLGRLVAEGRSTDGDNVTTTTRTVTTIDGRATTDRAAVCRALDADIANIDREARRPLQAQSQDWLRARRRQARDRQVALRC